MLLSQLLMGLIYVTLNSFTYQPAYYTECIVWSAHTVQAHERFAAK